jgi:hypothetical protein
MHLYNDLYLTQDSLNYIISRRSIVQSGKNKGNEKFSDIAFYGRSIKRLKKGLIELYTFHNIDNMDMSKLISNLDIILKKMEEIE